MKQHMFCMNSPADRKCSVQDARKRQKCGEEGGGDDGSDTPLQRKANGSLCPAPEKWFNSQEIIYCVSRGFEGLALER